MVCCNFQIISRAIRAVRHERTVVKEETPKTVMKTNGKKVSPLAFGSPTINSNLAIKSSFGSTPASALSSDIQDLLKKRDKMYLSPPPSPKKILVKESKVIETRASTDYKSSSFESFAPIYLSFIHSPSSAKQTDYSHELALLARYNLENEAQDPATPKPDKEDYTSNPQKIFKHFSNVLALSPRQCIRYEKYGKVVPFAKIVVGLVDSVQTTFYPKSSGLKCSKCGGTAELEFQLMPYVVRIREEFDFATVVVYTCDRDCVSGEGEWEYSREGCVVQKEVATRV